MNEFQKSNWDSFQEILNVKKNIRESLNNIQSIEDFFYQTVKDSKWFNIARNIFLNDTKEEKDLGWDFYEKIKKLHFHEIKKLENIIHKKWELEDEEKEFLSSIKLHKENIWEYHKNEWYMKTLNTTIIKKSISFWEKDIIKMNSIKTNFWYIIEISFNYIEMSQVDFSSIKNSIWRTINLLNEEVWKLRYKFNLKFDTFYNSSNNSIIIEYYEDLRSSQDYVERRIHEIKSHNNNILILDDWFFDKHSNNEIVTNDLKEVTLWTKSDFEKIQVFLEDIWNTLVVWNEKSWKTHFLKNILTSLISNWALNNTKFFIWDIENSWKFKDFWILWKEWFTFDVVNNKDKIADFLKFIFEEEFKNRKSLIKTNFLKKNWQLESISMRDRESIWISDIVIVLDWVQFNNPNSEIKRLIEKYLVSYNFFSFNQCWIYFLISSSNYRWKQYIISKDIISIFDTKVSFDNTKEWYSNIFWEYKISTNFINLRWMWDWMISYDSFNLKNIRLSDYYKSMNLNFSRERERNPILERFQSSYIEDSQIRTLISKIVLDKKMKNELEDLSREDSEI